MTSESITNNGCDELVDHDDGYDELVDREQMGPTRLQ